MSDRTRIHTPRIPKHPQEVELLTSLIIDLKLQLAGFQPQSPITAERLQAASDCVARIGACEEDDRTRMPWD